MLQRFEDFVLLPSNRDADEVVHAWTSASSAGAPSRPRSPEGEIRLSSPAADNLSALEDDSVATSYAVIFGCR